MLKWPIDVDNEDEEEVELEFVRNLGDGIKNDWKSNENWNEIEELSKQVTTLIEEMQPLQPPTKGSDFVKNKKYDLRILY